MRFVSVYVPVNRVVEHDLFPEVTGYLTQRFLNIGKFLQIRWQILVFAKLYRLVLLSTACVNQTLYSAFASRACLTPESALFVCA